MGSATPRVLHRKRHSLRVASRRFASLRALRSACRGPGRPSLTPALPTGRYRYRRGASGWGQADRGEHAPRALDRYAHSAAAPRTLHLPQDDLPAVGPGVESISQTVPSFGMDVREQLATTSSSATRSQKPFREIQPDWQTNNNGCVTQRYLRINPRGSMRCRLAIRGCLDA